MVRFLGRGRAQGALLRGRDCRAQGALLQEAVYFGVAVQLGATDHDSLATSEPRVTLEPVFTNPIDAKMNS